MRRAAGAHVEGHQAVGRVVHAAEWAGVVGLAQPAAIVGRELERALRRARVRDRHAAHAAPTEPCLSYSAQN
jgi:hypothetical protein